MECSEPVRVRVTVMLANRRIEIGKELTSKPCLFSAVLDHYRRHAVFDDAVLTEFARALEAGLKRLPLPPWRTTRLSRRRIAAKWSRPSPPWSIEDSILSMPHALTPATRLTLRRRFAEASAPAP
jgi:hypothetical protein